MTQELPGVQAAASVLTPKIHLPFDVVLCAHTTDDILKLDFSFRLATPPRPPPHGRLLHTRRGLFS